MLLSRLFDGSKMNVWEANGNIIIFLLLRCHSFLRLVHSILSFAIKYVSEREQGCFFQLLKMEQTLSKSHLFVSCYWIVGVQRSTSPLFNRKLFPWNEGKMNYRSFLVLPWFSNLSPAFFHVHFVSDLPGLQLSCDCIWVHHGQRPFQYLQLVIWHWENLPTGMTFCYIARMACCALTDLS